MRRYLLALVCVMGVLLACGTAVAALTASVSSEPFTIRAIAGVLNAGDSAKLLGGTANGTFGAGAIVLHNHVIKPSLGKGTYTLYTSSGSLSGSYTLHARVGGPHGVNGYTIVKGPAVITAGTGSWQGATGSFTISGKSPAREEYFLLKLKGMVVR